ncbi:EsaB/YukD family protein [Brevibacillus sp. B_LB10_24]|uniref:EsaB/YukD family protein n=1 Tax=Brevibacillus sp. B_LB10_24 TaxID=3380645 RepID=UPI0038B874E8
MAAYSPFHTVIVTLVTGPNEPEWPDFELPAQVPAGRLAPMIAYALKGEAAEIEHVHYLLEIKIADGDWRTLAEEGTLAELGVAEGAYLRVQKSYSTTPLRKPLDGWRPIFERPAPQYEDPGEADEEDAPAQGYVWKLLR